MTDRERINKAFGLLNGASSGVEWRGDGKDPRLLVSWQVINEILDILDVNNVDSTAQKST